MKNILLVEDDPTLSRNIQEALMEEKIKVEIVFDGLIAEKILRKAKFDCIILDINLPGKNGYDLCKDFRKKDKNTPIIILTAFGEIEDKVQGFEVGADDYLTKPFYMRELLARINAILKRRATPQLEADELLSFADIQVDTVKKKVSRFETEVQLTPREFQVLTRLMKANGELILKKDLIEEIWGSSFDTNTNTIEVYINFLRKKIDKPFGRNSIKTKVGFGYYIDEKE